MKKLLTTSVLLLLTFNSLLAQSRQQQLRYTEAKQSFSAGNFADAGSKFRVIVQDEKDTYFRKMASFYYALSLYHQGAVSRATAQLNELKIKFPNWKNRDEVYYWLGKIDAENGAFESALANFAELRNHKASLKIKEGVISQLSSDQIRTLLDEYPKDRLIAAEMVKRLLEEEPEERDRELLEFLMDDYGFDREDFGMGTISESVKKDKYKVALLLPFGYRSGAVRGRGSSTIMELYQGIEMALEKVNEKRTLVELYCYDTKADTTVLNDLLAAREMVGMDLIIGPLFPDNFKLAKKFSRKNQINIIHPLSNNDQLIDGNPYSLLVKPSLRTQASEMADYIEDKVETKNAAIFYGVSAKDAALAEAYKKTLEERKFTVKLFEQISDYADSRKIIDWLSLEQVDDEAIRRMGRTRKDFIEPELPKFFLDTMEIGHALIAGNNGDEVIVANAITSLVRRNDQMPLFGDLTWLNFRSISYDQLERLNVLLLAPDFANREKASFKEFRDEFFEKYNVKPGPNAIFSYDLFSWLSAMLEKYGTYFQTGLEGNAFYSGNNQEGFQYGAFRDNQVVPIVKMVDSKLVVLNREKD